MAEAMLGCRPIHRRSLTRQLRSLAKQPTKPTKNGVLSFLSGAAKFALQGAVVYLAVTALQGQHGKERLKEDFQAVAVRLLLLVRNKVGTVWHSQEQSCLCGWHVVGVLVLLDAEHRNLNAMALSVVVLQ